MQKCQRCPLCQLCQLCQLWQLTGPALPRAPQVLAATALLRALLLVAHGATVLGEPCARPTTVRDR